MHLPLTKNPISQDTDSAHSTARTIEKDLLEQFPESLSGKPLISNGLNVTDVLSYHNDQVRLAQELVTKANHLLEASKDFFEKPPAVSTLPPLPPPPPSPPVLSTVTENKSSVISSAPTSPPAMPNFNATREFLTEDISPKIKSTNEHVR